MTRVLWSIVVIASLAIPNVARAVPTDPEAKAHLERGNAAYAKGEYDTAVEEYRKGFAKEEDPSFLYTWAQAERKRGKCAAAVRLYQRYLATEPPELSADYARDGILKCADELAGDEPMPPGGDTVDDQGDPVGDLPSGDTTPDPEPEPPPDNRPKWPRDPAAIALVSIGSIGVIAGVGVLAAGGIENGKAPPTYGEFDDKQQKVRTLFIAGGIAAGVGVGLLAGGIARWMILRGRETNGSDTSVSALVGRGTLGLSLKGRF